MWNPLVIIRCKLVKICWRLGEGSMGTKRAVRLTCLYALEIFRMYYFITLLSSHSKNHLFLVMFFLRFLNPTPVCVCVSVHASPHHQHFSPTSLASYNPIQFWFSTQRSLRFKGFRAKDWLKFSHKTSPSLSTSNANFQLRLLPILLTNCLWVKFSANHLLGFD